MAMEQRLQFLNVDGANARMEFERLIDRYSDPPHKKYTVCFKLYQYLIEAANDPAQHKKVAHVWREFQSKTHGLVKVVLTETDPFVAYMLLEKGDPLQLVVVVIHLGEKSGRPAARFYNEVWDEVCARLQKLGL